MIAVKTFYIMYKFNIDFKKNNYFHLLKPRLLNLNTNLD